MRFDRDTDISEGGARKVVPFVAGKKLQHVALVSTFPPRKCGLATFASDVVEQVTKRYPNFSFDVWPIVRPGDVLPDTVAGSITVDNADAYRKAADRINATTIDAFWLQHEFGIFGGPDGDMVLDFVDRIAAPLIVTFHTVLEHPSASQQRIMDHLVQRASRIMVMSPLSRQRLIDHHHAPQEIVEVVEHGAPDRPFGREAEAKAALGLSTRPVLMTFGLLGPGKGLETAIQALPSILQSHPSVKYRIVGATHPNLVKEEGEKYRLGLEELASHLGVADAIEWENRFLDTSELLDQLEACDIYLTPYPNLQQSTSGTLSYAVALGKAVVSTPYIHARELLADNVGVLVQPTSAEAIADAVVSLLENPRALEAQKRAAWERGRLTIWPRFADGVAQMIERTITTPLSSAARREPSFDAVRRMSDATGMLQHAIGTIPDRHHGYCLDDNVRALMLANITAAVPASERGDWAIKYASFIQHAWNREVGAFRNFMHFDRSWCEERGSDDSNGRTLWSLARTALDNPNSDIREWATRLYDHVLEHTVKLESPRTVAFVTLGAAAMLAQRPGHDPSRDSVRHGGDLLERLLQASRRPDWVWFESMLAYDNPRLPQALIAAGEALDRADWVEIGLETLDWICERQTTASGQFRPVGSEGMGISYEQLPFDQQPLEAQAALDACVVANRVQPSRRWQTHGLAAWNWFFGANDRGVVLADPETGECRDGINPRGANLNCGAESILAFQLGYHSMLALLPERTNETGKPFEEQEQDGQKSVAYS